MKSSVSAAVATASIALLTHGTVGRADPAPARQPAPDLDIHDLFKNMRIPDITVAADGTVLAFAKSGRMTNKDFLDWAREFRGDYDGFQHYVISEDIAKRTSIPLRLYGIRVDAKKR